VKAAWSRPFDEEVGSMNVPRFLSTFVVLALVCASQASSQVIGQKTYLAGTKDNFTFPTEDPSPSSYLVASDQYPLLDFDQVPYVNVGIKDRKAAHTFRNLPRNISGGRLVLRAMSRPTCRR
jgi:hypothetical protein